MRCRSIPGQTLVSNQPTLGRLGIAQESFRLPLFLSFTPGLAIQRGGHFSLRSHSGEQKEIERKLLVLALSRAYLVTGSGRFPCSPGEHRSDRLCDRG